MFFSFSPYPGSEIHDQLVAEGKIVKDASYPDFLRRSFPGNFTDGLSWCPSFSGSTLQFLCLLGFAVYYGAQFLFRPHRLVATLYRIFTGKPLTYLELALIVSVKRVFVRGRIRLFGELDLSSKAPRELAA